MNLLIENIEKGYGSGNNYVQVLKKVSTKIKAGQICAILGPSGSGKSTFLNVIGGLETVDSGRIIVDDVEVSVLKGENLVDYRKEKVGFIFQFYNLISNLTVKENIQVCEYLSHSPLDINELMNTLGIYEQQNKFPSQMSGGQQQRCAIARALIKNPQLLLCDEPTGALDTKTSRDILELLERINKKYRTTILIVTHNPEIKKMAHKVIVIKDGHIIEDYINEVLVPASELEL